MKLSKESNKKIDFTKMCEKPVIWKIVNEIIWRDGEL